MVVSPWLRWQSSAATLRSRVPATSSQWLGSSADHRSSAAGRCAWRPSGRLVGEEEVVAGGYDAIDAGQPGHPVVGVELVALPGVVAQHHIGAEAAHPLAHPAAQGQGVLELAVGVVEEDHLARPEHGGGLLLLAMAGGDEVGHRHPRVPAPFGAVGDDEDGHFGAGGGPLGQGASRSELGVVGMSGHRQGTPRGGQAAGGGIGEVGVEPGHGGQVR